MWQKSAGMRGRSLGFSSREEIPPMIETAYYSGQNDWVASALYAMGRSADEVWVPLVLEMLENDNPDLRREAIRAAGDLEARQTVPRLVELLNDEDPDIHGAALWSLSQIGGEGVRDALNRCTMRPRMRKKSI
jgi:HEAT repeat protein